MKVIFVCRGNISRSQMAEAFFNNLSNHDAESAGTRAGAILARRNPPTTSLADTSIMTGQMTLRCMLKEEGLDISQQERTQITEQMFVQADKVVMIARRDT